MHVTPVPFCLCACRCTYSAAVAGDLGREEESKEEVCQGEEQGAQEGKDSVDGQ